MNKSQFLVLLIIAIPCMIQASNNSASSNNYANDEPAYGTPAYTIKSVKDLVNQKAKFASYRSSTSSSLTDDRLIYITVHDIRAHLAYSILEEANNLKDLDYMRCCKPGKDINETISHHLHESANLSTLYLAVDRIINTYEEPKEDNQEA